MQMENKILELRPYQKADVEFLSKQNSIAIFNEMRTGKTPTALAIFEKWQIPNLLIICPAILQNHWQKSIEQWLGKTAKVISNMNVRERNSVYEGFSWRKKDWIIIVSKDTFKNDAPTFKSFRQKYKTNFCVIVDEGHFLRNHKSDQSRAIYTLKDLKYKMVLTGTPMVNHASDIFGILHFLKPDEYSSYDDFTKEYFFVKHFYRKIELKNGKELVFIIPKILGYRSIEKREKLQSLINEFSTQHTQKETMPWLPTVNYHRFSLKLTKEQRAVYDRWMSEWDAMHPLELLTRLKTLILYPPSLCKQIDGARVYSGDAKDEKLTDEEWNLMKTCHGIKFDWVLEFCSEISNKSVIIFSTRSATFLEPLYKILKEKQLEVGMIIGSTSMKERTKLVEDFQNKKVRFLLCNIISAGLGLNLSEADVVIFADRSYSPADNEQAEDRFLPIQTEDVKPKMVIDLICEKTIDEKVMELLEKKQDITRLLIDNPDILF